jgi:hypothetical protein
MASPELTIELLKIYKSFADQINISADVYSMLHGVKDIKASGNEIEISLRTILKELLPNKYNISHGHIVDKDLNISKQYDLVITENIDYKSIAKTKDSTEIFFYETVFAIGEVKATWNLVSINSTVESIVDLKKRLSRKPISNNTILSGNSEIQVNEALTDNPIRNPVFTFAFALKSDKDLKNLKKIYLVDASLVNLPNITVILNEGIVVLVNKDDLAKGIVTINLYPEFIIDYTKYVWKFISSTDAGKNFAYLLFCLYEHLSNTILEKPPYLKYSSSILNINEEDLLDLDEL